ncbi:hypothetical protein B0H15DRAFT_405814 [Mycena belliarum]|uniref:Uncharacterized protein n=1 Tax=Mycena belliarum TaxID=1033014 RepID=A0AAD6U0T0_9AGAR|nr:hypothetical protein B0H15DRAFT_405814 [Mycena belliae]
MDVDIPEESGPSTTQYTRRPLLVVVDDQHPFDLDGYISNYTGNSRAARTEHLRVSSRGDQRHILREASRDLSRREILGTSEGIAALARCPVHSRRPVSRAATVSSQRTKTKRTLKCRTTTTDEPRGYAHGQNTRPRCPAAGHHRFSLIPPKGSAPGSKRPNPSHRNRK